MGGGAQRAAPAAAPAAPATAAPEAGGGGGPLGWIMSMIGGAVKLIMPLLLPLIFIGGIMMLATGKGGSIGKMFSGLMDKVGNLFGGGDGPNAAADAVENPAPDTQLVANQTASTQATKPAQTLAQGDISGFDKSKALSCALTDDGKVIPGSANGIDVPCDPASTVKSATLLTVEEMTKRDELPKGFIDAINQHYKDPKYGEPLVKSTMYHSSNAGAEFIGQLAATVSAQYEAYKASHGGSGQGFQIPTDITPTPGGGSNGVPDKTFVARMNEMAKDRKLTNTVFTNASGMPDGTMKSTVKDMAEWERVFSINHPDTARKYPSEGAEIRKDLGIAGGKTGTANGTHNPRGLNLDTASTRSMVFFTANGASGAVAEVEKGKQYDDAILAAAKKANTYGDFDVISSADIASAQTPTTNQQPTIELS